MATTKNGGKGSGDVGKRGKQAQRDLSDAVNATVPVLPYPRDLPPAYEPLWLETVNTKTADFWSPADMPLLAIYCRCIHEIKMFDAAIEDEGHVIFNANGNRVINPNIVARGYSENRLMALCTKLRMQPQSRIKPEVDANKTKRKAKANAAAATLEGDDDDLLAGGSATLQ